MATSTPPRPSHPREAVESVVIRFAGDSGDGMQVTGSQFTVETALAGNDLATFPDFPAEIRAPAGTTFGVSAFQIRFGTADVLTAGDAVDVLVAMNPAALKVELRDLKPSGTIVVDTGAFTERNLAKAGFPTNPLQDGSLAKYRLLPFDITKLTTDAVKEFGLGTKEAHRCRNMWALGLMLWMYGREREATLSWLQKKFAKRPDVAAANVAAHAGALGVTSSSGPGIAPKAEMLGLAIAAELPMVLVDSQRAGRSTGMPTKTEQSDLFQAVLGRNAASPLAVITPCTAGDCFPIGVEAVRLATKYMTPVIVLSDTYLAHAAEPWRIPEERELPRFPVRFRADPTGFHPFLRDSETLARPWALPGTPGLEHRIGGIEKDFDTGHISYDPGNHHRMTQTRAAKIAGIARDIPPQDVALGEDRGALAVVGWGSTFGAIHEARSEERRVGKEGRSRW